ncbi:ResB-like protein [Aeromicrobium marinum DSM 15272]|uniref:ResB-like protein n=1 Tax=Aeromicrobium marinum DSM 15272 TaxID=585531 RepID=E2SF11_9ACTN|nr:ResB-like protein [Aeromicrobium marinum DSM 15272]
MGRRVRGAAVTDETTTTSRPEASGAPALGGREFARWIWRQLTSMRTALLLLLLLAIASLPGSFVPQRSVDARATEAFMSRHPDLSPVLDALGFFSVYTSPWFSAIYLLLMVSLVGCILPRTNVYLKALRARPPRAPRNFARLPASGEFTTDLSVEETLAVGRRVVGRARVDVVLDGDGDAATGELRAEKGYLREFGNLVFHVSVVVVLVGVAAGALFSYRGASIVTEGDSFSNVLTQYDDFASGALFDPDDLPPFSLTLEDFRAEFQLEGPQRGAPREFEATGTFVDGLDGAARPFEIEVNHPLQVGSTAVYLVGQGYAPIIRVTQPDGTVVFDEAVPFLPEDATYTSTGVVKVPDTTGDQIGMRGFFLPTAVSVGEDEASISAFPAAANPYVAMQVWTGDLGLDDGRAQSVFSLDTRRMDQVLDDDGDPFRVELVPGQEIDLPDGTTVAFTGLRQFVRFQVSSTPLVQLPLWGVIAGLVGISLSLFVRPRRIWIRARRDGSRTVVEVAALDRVPRDDLGDDLQHVIERMRTELSGGQPGSKEPS